MMIGARGRGAAAIVCLLGTVFAASARAQISQSQSARDYAARLTQQLEAVTAERDAALVKLDAERKRAKAAIDKTMGKAVAREVALTEARRGIASLEPEVGRLEGEIEGLVVSRLQADRDQAKREVQLIERARSAEIDRSEVERLADESRIEGDRLRAELAAREETARQTASVHVQQLGDLQNHILDLERSLTTETETRLALQSRAPVGSAGNAEERITGLQKDLEQRTLEINELAKKTGQDQSEIRALRSTRNSLEKELEAARERADGSFADFPAEDGIEEQEPGELRRLLALERERRSTLEGELVRLSATGDLAERYQESWQALQAAKADLLMLAEKLTQEQARREELEGLLERARGVAEARHGDDTPLDRLIDVADQHGRETAELEAQLREVNDHVTRLRGYLETMESPDGGGPALVRLDEENAKLKTSLAAAENTIGRLSGKAALAERLAELVYQRNPKP